MYKTEMLGFLFEAYSEKGFKLWEVHQSYNLNGLPDLDEIVRETPVDKVEAGNVYLAVPINHGKSSVEEAIKGLFVTYFDFIIAMYAFAIKDECIIAVKENGNLIYLNYFEFINAVQKLPNMNDY